MAITNGWIPELKDKWAEGINIEISIERVAEENQDWEKPRGRKEKERING